MHLLLVLTCIMLVRSFLTRCVKKQLPFVSVINRFHVSGLRCGTTETPVSLSDVPHKFSPIPFKYHEEVDIVIDDLTNLGLGVGRKVLPDGSSWVIMVPTVLPGEEVRVKIFRNNPNYSEADLVSVLKESPDRVKPLCKYFNECGGCQYQHMNISAQRLWKRSQVVDLLQRIGGFTGNNTLHVNEIVGSDKLYGYRSKLTPHYDKPNRNKPLAIGFQKRNTRITIDIDDCIIASDRIREAYKQKRWQITCKPFTKLGVSLLFREGDDGVVVSEPKRTVKDTVEGITFEHKASEFFQNNPSVLGAMVRHVLSKAAGEGLRHLIDAYCGSGLFALCGAAHFSSVYGVELSPQAIEAAKHNAKLNGIANAHFVCSDSDVIFKKTSHLPADHTVIIIDPPRKGCDASFLSQLCTFRPKRVVYVSCDPSTQSRDARIIVDKGGYRVMDVTPFDLFPQTRHIENVMVFERD